MSKHTPGPWAANLETYPIMVSSQSETWPLVDELGNEEGCTGAFVCNTGDNKANARLIAAAPELLEALKNLSIVMRELHDHWDNDRDMKVGKGLLALSGLLPGYDKRIDVIHAAIAKATGGNNV